MTKILWIYTFTYIIVMAESNDWTQVRKCEASPESKWNSYQEKLQKEAQDRERENRYNLKKEKEPRKQSLMNSVIISKRNISFNKGSQRSFHFSVSDVKM